MAQADEAHRIMTASTHTGKIVLYARRWHRGAPSNRQTR